MVNGYSGLNLANIPLSFPFHEIVLFNYVSRIDKVFYMLTFNNTKATQTENEMTYQTNPVLEQVATHDLASLPLAFALIVLATVVVSTYLNKAF